MEEWFRNHVLGKSISVTIRDDKTWAIAKRKVFNKHFEGANSELNSLYFPRKTP